MNDFQGIASQIGGIVESKNAAYGSSFAKAGEFLRLLYPDGIPVEKYDDMLLLVRIFDKQMRIATDRDALGESPFSDIAGYGILGVAMNEAKLMNEANNSGESNDRGAGVSESLPVAGLRTDDQPEVQDSAILQRGLQDEGCAGEEGQTERSALSSLRRIPSPETEAREEQVSWEFSKRFSSGGFVV